MQECPSRRPGELEGRRDRRVSQSQVGRGELHGGRPRGRSRAARPPPVTSQRVVFKGGTRSDPETRKSERGGGAGSDRRGVDELQIGAGRRPREYQRTRESQVAGQGRVGRREGGKGRQTYPEGGRLVVERELVHAYSYEGLLLVVKMIHDKPTQDKPGCRPHPDFSLFFTPPRKSFSKMGQLHNVVRLDHKEILLLIIRVWNGQPKGQIQFVTGSA